MPMQTTSVFTPDHPTEKPLTTAHGAPIAHVARRLAVSGDPAVLEKGRAFSREITDRFVGDFEKEGDKMAHVSTFVVEGGTVYMTYYANTVDPAEDPTKQTARLAYAPKDRPWDKVILDVQAAGDTVDGRVIDMVYDSILMRKDEDTLMVLWTARTEGNYYRFYCPFSMSQKTLGKIGVNRFRVGEVTNDFSASGIRSALAENGLPIKTTYSDIGIMQKQSFRMENGRRVCYSGTYSGDFNCIIKSEDLITWEYVSQPDFVNDSKWENATFVLDDRVYYFVRQQNENPCGFLTAYNLDTGLWDTPVEIEDCQSRGDFILYGGELYLFHAPRDRRHIGIVRIGKEDLGKSEILLQAEMDTGCFYPFVDYFEEGALAMSYTVDREHIRLARFSMEKYV